MRINWFELFSGEENGKVYPIIAGMEDEKCVKLIHLKSCSIAELENIFSEAPLAGQFLVAHSNKALPTPIVENDIRKNVLDFAMSEAAKKRQHAPNNVIDNLVLDPLRPIMIELGHLGSNQTDSFFNWCAAWVTYICRSVEVKIPDRYGNFFASVALVDSWRDMGKRTGAWFPKGSQQPQAGDIVCFNWDGDSDLDHIGIVRGLEPGAVLTCEGNHDNQEGLFTRNLAAVSGFVDIEILANQLKVQDA